MEIKGGVSDTWLFFSTSLAQVVMVVPLVPLAGSKAEFPTVGQIRIYSKRYWLKKLKRYLLLYRWFFMAMIGFASTTTTKKSTQTKKLKEKFAFGGNG